MLQKLKKPIYCIMIFTISYIPASFIESKVFAEPKECIEGNPHHETKCDMCDKGHQKCDMCGKGHHKDYVSGLIWLAYSAQKELLKEKMKMRLEEKAGKKLDEVANLAVDAMINKYKEMRKCKKSREEFEENLKDIFVEDEEEEREQR